MSVDSTAHCDECGELRVLWHNESTGLALCEQCDTIQDTLDLAAYDTAGTIEPDGTILLEREYSGLRVELKRLPLMSMNVIACTVGDTTMSTFVEDDKAYDAFHHPCLYLAPTQVAELGIK